jgi:hypothetical protein
MAALLMVLRSIILSLVTALLLAIVFPARRRVGTARAAPAPPWRR